MNFKGAARRIEDSDLPRIGFEINVGEDEIHAVLDVESAGRGFDSQGRPKMLFEPHVFYRELGAGAKRDAAVKAGIAYAEWKPGNYPSDSYPRLEKAMQIDQDAALRSASWGLGQIMGFNFKLCGYPTVKMMVEEMVDDEDNHLEAMIEFILAKKLDDDLRRHDWAGFAYGYNGAGYAKHGYHSKLAAAYAKWTKIKDTPWSPAAVEKAWEKEDAAAYDDDPTPPVVETKPLPTERPADGADDILVDTPEPKKGFWAWFWGLFS